MNDAACLFRFMGFDRAPGELGIFTLPDARARWFDDVEKGAQYASQEARTKDVYFHVNPHDSSRVTNGKRGNAETATALLGLWADIDVRDGLSKHKNPNLPLKSEVRRALKDLPLRASALVQSAGGYHVYWTFREPFVIETDGDRKMAERLIQGWQAFLTTKLAPFGRMDL